MISRKSFLASGLVLAANFCTSSTAQAQASDSLSSCERLRELTDLLGKKLAECPVETTAIIPLYDLEGIFIGACLEYTYLEQPYGFAILDLRVTGGLGGFCIGPEVLTPRELIAPQSLDDQESSFLIVLDGINFGIQTPSKLLLKEGVIERPSPARAFSSAIGGWDEVFMDLISLTQDYFYLSSCSCTPFGMVSEGTILTNTSHYACAVTAGYAVAYFFGAVTDMATDWNEYNWIWSATGTTTESTGVYNGQNVTYGTTTDANYATGLQSYLGAKGLNVTAALQQSRPSYSQIWSSVHGGNICTMHVRIQVAGSGLAGHSMTVARCVQWQHNTSSTTIDSTVVYDGWNSYGRYINNDYSNFYNYYMTFFT